jgi:hypothetical protein
MKHSLLLTALAALLPIAALTAQDPTEVGGLDTPGIPIQPEFWPAVPTLDIPVPPGPLVGGLPPHAAPAIPEGAPQPGPNTPPSVDIPLDAPQPMGTGAFTYFQNRVVKPTNTSTSSTGEPSVALAQDTVWQTGNWYAARSLDNGETWTHVSPYSRFGALDGGFCCDQRMYYVDSSDIAVWLLQYSYSSTTQNGSYRIAVANGRADLAAGSTGSWTSWTFSPQSFGFAAGNWLDFPDIAQGGDWLYASANVFSAGGSYVGSVIWRMEIADLASGSALSFAYLTNATIDGATYRIADRPSTDDRCYFAAFDTTTSVFVYYYTNTGTWSRVSRTVGSWTNATAACPGPDGRDWCGRVVGRFRGAFSTPTQLGFVWTSAGNGGSRPLPYTRIARFTADANRTLIGEQDIWNSTLTWAYGTGRGNSSGDVGMVFALGGPSSYVRSTATIYDSYQPFGGSTTTTSMNSGTHGPSSNRWGDYFDVHLHPTYGRTFIGTGMAQNGGTGGASNDPRYVWFGRNDHEPTWVNLLVESTGVSGVPITLSVTSLDGLKNGNTNFSRRFAPNQGYAVTAPSSVISGSVTYSFERWATKSVATSASYALQPIGDLTYETTTIGVSDDLAEARYKIRRTLTVNSSNPASGVAITISPTDINGNGNGTTGFTRFYRDDQVVTLTAPAAIGPDPFRRWVVGRTIYPEGQNSINLTMTGDLTATAQYWNFVQGSWNSIGAGCVGGNRQVPVHTIVQAGNNYVQGSPMTFRCTGAPASTGGVLLFGFSTTNWGAFVLPLDLSIIGGNGCVLYHDVVVTEGANSSAAGVAAYNLTIPVEPALVGASSYTTFSFIDPLAPRPLPLTYSNAVRLRQGGYN